MVSFDEAPFLGLQSSLCVLMWGVEWGQRKRWGERGRESPLLSSYKGTNPIMGTPPLMTWSKPHHPLESPPPNTITLGIRAWVYEWQGLSRLRHLVHGTTVGVIWKWITFILKFQGPGTLKNVLDSYPGHKRKIFGCVTGWWLHSFGSQI